MEWAVCWSSPAEEDDPVGFVFVLQPTSPLRLLWSSFLVVVSLYSYCRLYPMWFKTVKFMSKQKKNKLKKKTPHTELVNPSDHKKPGNTIASDSGWEDLKSSFKARLFQSQIPSKTIGMPERVAVRCAVAGYWRMERLKEPPRLTLTNKLLWLGGNQLYPVALSPSLLLFDCCSPAYRLWQEQGPIN